MPDSQQKGIEAPRRRRRRSGQVWSSARGDRQLKNLCEGRALVINMFAEARSVCSPQTYMPVTVPSSDCLLCVRARCLLFSLLYCLPLFSCDVLRSFLFFFFFALFFLILAHFIVLMSPRLSEYKHRDEPQQVHNHRQIF